ncbi:type II toxin-antitoxin system RelE/ParE family toxin [Neotabrizicola sp. VNH66]|uniref:type II toxin-antitoxin system RelE/ParE family toxin n=1 Tax=Neotabrizicola sp. VNH66 TaxID=3400918 RepID=UPI003C09C260
MTWRIEFASAAERDFALIRDHLIESYLSFGDSPAEATERAAQRLIEIFDDTQRIATAPHRGTRHDDLLPGLRQLTLGKASFWFITDDEAGLIRVLAVFFGAQEQHRRMLIRLLEPRHG